MADLADCTEQMNVFLICSLFAISICINPYLDYIIILRLCVSCYLEVLGPHSGPWCHLLPCQRGWIGVGRIEMRGFIFQRWVRNVSDFFSHIWRRWGNNGKSILGMGRWQSKSASKLQESFTVFYSVFNNLSQEHSEQNESKKWC